MFSKATARFVRQVDPEGSLIPVSVMNDSSKLLPTALVVKHKRVWFWQRPKYQTTDFKLSDLLLGDEVLIPDVSRRDFLTYVGAYGNKVSGKLDVEILSAEAQGSSKLLSDFGKLDKEEVDVKKLLQDSEGRLVNMEHELVQQLEKRSDVLAVVKERILTTAACTVTQTQKEQCALRAMLRVLGNLGANMKACIESNHSNVSVEVRSDFVIAYGVLELEIQKEGHFKLCLRPGKIGGFETITDRSWSSEDDLVVDGMCTDGNIPEEQPQQNGSFVEDLSPLAALSQSNRQALFHDLQAILTNRMTLSDLQSHLEELHFGKTPDTAQQENQLDSVDGTFASLNSVLLLVSALEELPDETLSLMRDSQPEFLEAFSTLLNLMEESSRRLSFGFLPTLLVEQQAFQQAEKLLSSIGVTLSVENNQLWLEMEKKDEVQLLVLRLSAYGLSLLCSGQK
ncbi:gasdermin-E-like [Syngnathus typhle]|uniref:gasdermin-E-like n=1 Tax=Syngnathus typhle TaxID=161592 RepID=UPI002A6A4B61|nr:gasdermin-E-like [Syngnathus typhle]XP_061124074.1 gasdermin-E-like [Syngnathus typhle]